MDYPYSVMRTLASPVGGVMLKAYATQVSGLERRLTRRLQAGLPPNEAADVRVLVKGCEAALKVLYETPEIIEKWDNAPDQPVIAAPQMPDGDWDDITR